MPDNVYLDAWFPQPSVVAKCDLFIHHGGNNSFCEALYFGVPSLIFFASSGILGEMLTIAQGTAEYNAQAFSSLQAFWGQMENYVWFRWWHWGPLIILAVSYWLLAIGSKQKAFDNRYIVGNVQTTTQSNPPFPTIILWLWVIAGSVFVIIQAKGFDTHWIPLLPPLVMLASAGLDGILTRFERIDRRLMVAGTAAAIVLFAGILAKDTWVRAWPFLTGQQSQRAYLRRFQAGDLNAADSLRMARWLEQRTARGDSVYIWGVSNPEPRWPGRRTPRFRSPTGFSRTSGAKPGT